jgi:hypothetical protein
MNVLSIQWIQDRLETGRYLVSRHADDERAADNLTLAEIRQALLTGRILEHYTDTGRGTSCLVVGFTNAGKPVHVVCGVRSDYLIIVTVYIPKPPKFKSPYERGEQG